MIKHVVLFKMKEFETIEQKQNALQEIKKALEALLESIEVLKEIHVGINVNPDEEYDLVLDTLFDNLEALALYANHPQHMAVSKELIAPIKVKRACVDYSV